MSKIYVELEKLLKYRITSNEEIPSYLDKLIKAGKFDEPKKNAVIILLLTRLATLEDEHNVLLRSLPDIIDKRIEKLTDPLMSQATVPMFTCDTCHKVCKNELGLQAHKRSHKAK